MKLEKHKDLLINKNQNHVKKNDLLLILQPKTTQSKIYLYTIYSVPIKKTENRKSLNKKIAF